MQKRKGYSKEFKRHFRANDITQFGRMHHIAKYCGKWSNISMRMIKKALRNITGLSNTQIQSEYSLHRVRLWFK